MPSARLPAAATVSLIFGTIQMIIGLIALWEMRQVRRMNQVHRARSKARRCKARERMYPTAHGGDAWSYSAGATETG